ncbi:MULTISPECIES: TRAP transporter small permease [Nesterenkonia]|uniref:TRAP-type C4-dicarboxylate transport system permease small subunit n=1 Tax=Nesterenkonia xinjiangensis TaxID=225327 RepID=A0A7Z0GJV8_9MICC|nr:MULTISPECIES: TRAP transporter small permease [Nesterenkonia]MDZ5076603.1 TRAP transporter small permease [Nesterenkonia sp. HG001]NYJ77325.1 TRAP-type C4-dicarboxylate transport system permease small subunit [Nesterenkonia xinjiangensis]
MTFRAATERAMSTLFRAIEIMMVIFLISMVLFVFLNMALRYLFDSGLVWSEEIARLCFIYLVYLGAVGAFRENRHLGMHTLLERVPLPAQKTLYTIVQLIIIWVMVLLVSGSWDLVVQSMGDRWVATQYPRPLIYAIGLITGLAISLMALMNILRLFAFKLTVAELLAIPDDDTDLLRQAAN